jgi:glycosyltransferase involved in cell wall biosynthesis
MAASPELHAPPMKVTIVTPCRNAAGYIRETVESVLTQRAVESGRASLQYIVCDGASSDGTARIVDELASPFITIVSEPDNTMYEALAKGLSRATGDIVAYLNAGDYYHPLALDVVLDVFESRPVSWLTGFSTIYNEAGTIVSVTLPFRYRQRLFECGAYGRLLPFLQQEATFWRRELHAFVDLEALAKMRYAGDYLLWLTFARHAELHVVEAALGGFRRHAGQVSENMDAYLREMRQITRDPNLIDFTAACWDRLIWHAPPGIKKYFNDEGLLRYDHATRQWR